MLSILEFCRLAGISRATYYRLKERGEGPAETAILSRRLIAKATAETWLQSLEVKAAA